MNKLFAVSLAVFAAGFWYEHGRFSKAEMEIASCQERLAKQAKALEAVVPAVDKPSPAKNIFTAALLPAILPTAGRGASAPEDYVIAKNDTLWSLSGRFYGNPLKYKDLAQANGIAGPDYLIYSGRHLRIPRDGAVSAAIKAKPSGHPPRRPVFENADFAPDDDEELPAVSEAESVSLVRLIAQVPRLVEAIGLPSVRYRLKGIGPDKFADTLRSLEDQVLDKSQSSESPPEIFRNDSGEEVPPRIYRDLNGPVKTYYDHYQLPELALVKDGLSDKRIRHVMEALRCDSCSPDAFRSEDILEAVVKLYYFDQVNRHGGKEALEAILKEGLSRK
ncbi:MAG: LysM peptidoglycan-binding domain-containing protein [Candidatus Saccharibacteria bacterium]